MTLSKFCLNSVRFSLLPKKSRALASGVGPVVMRLVDSLASDGFLGPGAMFYFAACLQLIASYFSCQLPPARSNSRSILRIRSQVSRRETSEEMAVL